MEQGMTKTCSVVLTTVNSPSARGGFYHEVYRNWHDVAAALNGKLIIVGDEKTPDNAYVGLFDAKHYEYLSLTDQDKWWPELSALIGRNTYCRKELGYLHAFEQSDFVFETDDDNYPMGVEVAINTLHESMRVCDGDSQLDWTAKVYASGPYNYYGEVERRPDRWARGLPFWYRERWGVKNRLALAGMNVPCVCWMPAGEPDYCALCRMMHGNSRLERTSTDRAEPALVGKIPEHPWVFSVFNSQATLWSRVAMPQMLLALSCHQRAADLIRSYIVQVYHPALLADGRDWVKQTRNVHDMLTDYQDEFSAAAGFDRFLETRNVFDSFRIQPHIAHAHNVEWLRHVSKLGG